MNVRRGLLHTVVVFYLVVTSCAFVYTLTRSVLPPVGKQLVLLSFVMMSPFPGYDTEFYALSAEGIREDGSRVPVSLDRYYPVSYGERLVRGYLAMFRILHGNEEGIQAYQRMSQLIAEHEQERGNVFQLVRLYWDVWPLSPDGTFALRKSPTLRREPVSLSAQ